MRKNLVNMFCFGLIGGFLSSLGASLDSVEFWVIIIAALVVQVNSGID